MKINRIKERIKKMEFTHRENEIILLDENGNLLAQITFPYIDRKGTTVNVNHTFVDTSLRGQGIAGKLMEELIKELQGRNLKAVPSCSYASGWFEKHPEYSALLK